MKGRLKETLDEKRDFEIEFLQLQKNYLKTKNSEKELQSNKREASRSDTDKIGKLEAAMAKAN